MDERPPTEAARAGPPHDQPYGEQGSRYNAALARLLSEYQDSGEDTRPWQIWSDGEFEDGPAYRTSEQARSAARYHRSQVEVAEATLPEARTALRAAAEQLEELQRELEHTRPWQRSRRSELRECVIQANDTVDDRYYEMGALEATVDWSTHLYAYAMGMADWLHRNERVHQAACQAAAKEVGWQPGQLPLARAPGQPVALPGRVVRSGDTGPSPAPAAASSMAPRAQQLPGHSPCP